MAATQNYVVELDFRRMIATLDDGDECQITVVVDEELEDFPADSDVARQIIRDGTWHALIAKGSGDKNWHAIFRCGFEPAVFH